ncbi:MAG: DNA repair protein RadC [Cytophagales bacterium]
MEEKESPYQKLPSKKSLNIKDWAEEDRPREKFLLKGKSSLSDAELIAILIGSGNAELSAVDLSKLILKKAGNDLNLLAKMSIQDLVQFKGMGEAKAISIAAALELGRRRIDIEKADKPKISNANTVYELMKPHLSDLPFEEFWIIFLNRSNLVIAKEMLGRGGIAGVMVDKRLVFKQALQYLCSSVILVHNHPSGNLQPSREDVSITTQIRDAGELLDIKLLDHVIFTDYGFYSFAEDKDAKVDLS